MTEGYEPKPIPTLVTQTQVTFGSTLTCNAHEKISALSNISLSALTYNALDPMPTGRTLIGVNFLWTNSGILVPVDILVNRSDQTISIQLYNPSDSAVTFSGLRLLMFWE